MADRLPAVGLPIVPSQHNDDGPGRILLLSRETGWCGDFKNLTKQIGFRLKRVEGAVDALVHISEFDPHIVLVNEYPIWDLTIVDLCDALRVPRLLRPVALLTTTAAPVTPGEDLGELGVDEILDADLPVEHYTSALVQHHRLAVTQRRVLDREREILDSLPDALAVLDGQLAVWKVNRAFAALFGVSDLLDLRRHLGEPLTNALASCLPGASGERAATSVSKAIELALRTGKNRFECRVVLMNGERFLAGQTTELAGSGGQVLVTIRDVTDREQQLLREARRERLATIGNLSVGVAHEIQNPNTFSRVNAANLKDLFNALSPLIDELAKENPERKIGALTITDMTAKIESAISGVETASKRIGAVLETLKGFGQTGGDSIRDVDVKTVIAEAELLTKHVLRGKAELTVDLPDDLPPVRASASELSQVFINLIENAVQAFDFPGQQARGEGSAKIQIHVDGLTEVELTLAVTDNGPGIDNQLQAQIFRPYFTTRAQGVGTGLGLSLSSDIMRRFGGDLTVRSRRGAGASFLVSLKRADIKAELNI